MKEFMEALEKNIKSWYKTEDYDEFKQAMGHIFQDIWINSGRKEFAGKQDEFRALFEKLAPYFVLEQLLNDEMFRLIREDGLLTSAEDFFDVIAYGNDVGDLFRIKRSIDEGESHKGLFSEIDAEERDDLFRYRSNALLSCMEYLAKYEEYRYMDLRKMLDSEHEEQELEKMRRARMENTGYAVEESEEGSVVHIAVDDSDMENISEILKSIGMTDRQFQKGNVAVIPLEQADAEEFFPILDKLKNPSTRTEAFEELKTFQEKSMMKGKPSTKDVN